MRISPPNRTTKLGITVEMQECAERISNLRLFEGQDATRGQRSESLGDLANVSQLNRPQGSELGPLANIRAPSSPLRPQPVK